MQDHDKEGPVMCLCMLRSLLVSFPVAARNCLLHTHLGICLFLSSQLTCFVRSLLRFFVPSVSL